MTYYPVYGTKLKFQLGKVGDLSRRWFEKKNSDWSVTTPRQTRSNGICEEARTHDTTNELCTIAGQH